MSYRHTQHGHINQIVIGVAFVLLAFAWMAQGDPLAYWILFSTGMALGVISFMFGSLTIRDEGDYLAVRFGPIPLFGTKFYYKEITAIAPDRTTWIDGWGIHRIPWRGTTWNLWGFSCVRLNLGEKIYRIGTDDVDNLVTFLEEKAKKS